MSYLPSTIIFLLSLFIYNMYTFSSICKYINDDKNYQNLLCSYQIYHYIVIYDLCYEDYPNLLCFTSKLPTKIIFSLHNSSNIMQQQKSPCFSSIYCSYIKNIKGIYPLPIGNRIKSLMKVREIITSKINNSEQVNIVIGSGIAYKSIINRISNNWINTDQDVLDITNRYDITQYLNPETVDNMVAMHVLEHIFYYDIFNSLLNLKYLLKHQGKLFLCLPDLNAKTSPYWKNYSDAVARQPLYGHRVMYSYESLKYIIEKCNLSFHPLSYHLVNGDRVVNKPNYSFFDKIDIKEYIISKINFDQGYSLCGIIEKN